MKVAILAGGLGTRLGEETGIKPKPMVEVGGKPILWHIMKIYSHYGFKEFVILCGYKQEYIKEYFKNYYFNNCDITFDLANNSHKEHSAFAEDWKVTVLDTGANSYTGARIMRAKEYLKDDTFMLTYGDGVADIDMQALLECHKKASTLATLTAVQPEGRFGVLEVDENNRVQKFQEKPKDGNTWINGGFFVLEPKIFDYLTNEEDCIWEQEPLRTLATDNQLNMYKHEGFWRPMDMLKDKLDLNEMWDENKAPWKIWK